MVTSTMPVSLDWFVFPLAVDFVNSRIETPAGVIDLLESQEDASAWAEAVDDKALTATAVIADLSEASHYRDEIRELLEPVVGKRHWSARQVKFLNEHATNFRPYLEWNDGTTCRVVDDSNLETFKGEIATSVLQIAGDSKEKLKMCSAPRCGGFFMAHDTRQRWCTPTCGNRARVARHANRTKQLSQRKNK